MSTQPFGSRVTRPSLVLALALALWSTLPAPAAEPEAGKKMSEAKMKEHCEAMQEQKLEMKEAMKVQDAELTEQLAKMNAAPEDQKTGLMAAVVTHMVEQRMTRDAQKAKMEEKMMQHMMQHMEMGKEGMSGCPMMKGMKGMKDMDDKSAGAHKAHHDEQK